MVELDILIDFRYGRLCDTVQHTRIQELFKSCCLLGHWQCAWSCDRGRACLPLSHWPSQSYQCDEAGIDCSMPACCFDVLVQCNKTFGCDCQQCVVHAAWTPTIKGPDIKEKVMHHITMGNVAS